MGHQHTMGISVSDQGSVDMLLMLVYRHISKKAIKYYRKVEWFNVVCYLSSRCLDSFNYQLCALAVIEFSDHTELGGALETPPLINTAYAVSRNE